MDSRSVPSSSSAAALASSVTALRSTLHLLDASINTLDSGVADFPRLAKVLQTTRHFDLVSTPHLHAAQHALVSELAPEISTLLTRVETHLEKLDRRAQSLEAKAALQEGRLTQRSSSASLATIPAVAASGARVTTSGFVGGNGSRPGAGGKAASSEEALTQLEAIKLQQLRLKRERLSYAVSRLELQAGQRERQLRKSMAAL